MIPVNRPLITEEDIAAVSDSLRHTLISGDTPPIRLLEEKLSEFLGVENTVMVSSGTTALDLSVHALDLTSGDEVVAPTFTIISTVSQALRQGLRVKLVDADARTWSMDADQTVAAINDQTKLVIPVHIYGLACDLDPIIAAARKVGAFVLEDAAEALGVSYNGNQAGSIGDAGIFSFYANKVITGGEGGAISSSNKEFIEKVRYIRNLCFRPEERFVHTDLGWNARLNGLSATLINSQLQRISLTLKRKSELAARYREALAGLPEVALIPESTEYSTNANWVFPILLTEDSPFNAAELQEKLRDSGVDTRRFFCPIHLQPLVKNYDIAAIGDFPVSENLWRNGLYLPCGVGTLDSEVDQVVEALLSAIKSS
jgi:perosamine synthetase